MLYFGGSFEKEKVMKDTNQMRQDLESVIADKNMPSAAITKAVAELKALELAAMTSSFSASADRLTAKIIERSNRVNPE